MIVISQCVSGRKCARSAKKISCSIVWRRHSAVRRNDLVKMRCRGREMSSKHNTFLVCTCVGRLGPTLKLSYAKRYSIFALKIVLLLVVGHDRSDLCATWCRQRPVFLSFKSSCRMFRSLRSEILAFQTPHNGAINWTNRMNEIHAANTQNGCFIGRVLGWARLGQSTCAHSKCFFHSLSRHFSLGFF